MNPDEPLFPGFKVPPNDPSREIRPAFTVSRLPDDEIEPREDDGTDDEQDPYGRDCSNCEGWGYLDCFCGGDLCVCSYGGQVPCPKCGGI